MRKICDVRKTRLHSRSAWKHVLERVEHTSAHARTTTHYHVLICILHADWLKTRFMCRPPSARLYPGTLLRFWSPFFPRFWTGWTHIGEMNDKLFKISSTLAGETKSLFFTRIWTRCLTAKFVSSIRTLIFECVFCRGFILVRGK